jgi:hypothetical protein
MKQYAEGGFENGCFMKRQTKQLFRQIGERW